LQAFGHAHAGAIEQGRDQPFRATQVHEYLLHFRARQHDRQVLRALGTDDVHKPWQIEFEHIAIQKQHGRQRLVLRRSRHLAVYRERSQELLDFRAGQLARVP
jgi:hypothetical protein